MKQYIYEFIEQVYPDGVDLAISMFNEKTCLKDATIIIRYLKAENERLKAYERFYKHIRKCVDEKYSDCNHVICAICNDTFERITQVSEQALQGKKGGE